MCAVTFNFVKERFLLSINFSFSLRCFLSLITTQLHEKSETYTEAWRDRIRAKFDRPATYATP